MYILAKIVPYIDIPGHFIQFHSKLFKDYKEAVTIAAKERYNLVTIYDDKTTVRGLEVAVHNLGMPDKLHDKS